ncbi:MAG TPA: hypothetical protein VLX56_00585 [Nitrososphaerales archaeon]|nr:hypothetical protein [Nitrososphaerales archaeon]
MLSKKTSAVAVVLVVAVIGLVSYQVSISTSNRSETTGGLVSPAVSSASSSSSSASFIANTVSAAANLSANEKSVEPGPSLKGYVLNVTIVPGASASAAGPGFVPRLVSVFTAINNTVRWTNDDSVAHTVTFTSVPPLSPPIDSGPIQPGGSFTYTFTVQGTYEYHCSYFPFMNGTIVQLGEYHPYA